MKPLTRKQIEEAGTAVDRVDRLDKTIEWIGQDIDQAAEWGEKIRHVFGQNRLGQLTNEKLGQVVSMSIINALLMERAQHVAEHKAVVEFSDPPCPEQDIFKIISD